jgi:transcriptional regulator with XRE-family HTH domain
MKNDILNKIAGKNIRSIRLKNNISQEDLADLCGMHRTYIGGIERGERNITLQTLECIASALKVPAKTLIEETKS